MHRSRIAAALLLALLIPGLPNAFAQSLTHPRAMAEWEELDGVVVVWYEQRYLELLELAGQYGWTPPMRAEYEALMETQAAMITAVLAEGIEVYVPDDATNTYDVADTLASLGVGSPNLQILPYDRGNSPVSVWIRDTGPMNVYKNGSDSLYAVGWQRNIDTPVIASGLGLPSIHLTEGASHFLDGGNYMTDGHGKLFCDDWHDTSAPYQQTFNDVFGINEFVDLPAYRVHVDYYMKLISEEVLLVSEIPYRNYIGIEPSFDDSLYLDAAIQTVQENAVSCFGRPYEVVRIRNAPSYDDWSDASYTNSLIINRTVLVPTFEHPETDTVAVRIYEQEMPGYNIVGVPSVYFAAMGGATHCITKEIGVSEPVTISHAWYPDSLNQITDYPIYATIRTRSGVDNATVYWSSDPPSGYEPLAMAPAGGSVFIASIPGQPYGTRVHYYMEAMATSGKTMRKPIVAPHWAYNFLVDPAGASTGVRPEPTPPLALAVQLGPSFPNPFRQTTSMTLSMTRGGPALVRVYDVSGRCVGELLNGTIPAGGRRPVAWDGRDQSGKRAAPGVYFIRLEAADQTATQKVLLVR
jgi:agmatine/peptidylarginine deiminase